MTAEHFTVNKGCQQIVGDPARSFTVDVLTQLCVPDVGGREAVTQCTEQASFLIWPS